MINANTLRTPQIQRADSYLDSITQTQNMEKKERNDRDTPPFPLGSSQIN